jgi:hypothetical protein
VSYFSNHKKNYFFIIIPQLEESLHLLAGEVEVTTIDQCNAMYSKITTTTICAGPYHVNGLVYERLKCRAID